MLDPGVTMPLDAPGRPTLEPRVGPGAPRRRCVSIGRALRSAGLLLLSFSVASPIAAQDTAGMQRTLERFLDAWRGGDPGALEAVLRVEGVALRMEAAAHGPIRPRQAAAALVLYMGERDGGEFTVNRVSHAGGEPERGFAEVEWTTVVKGTSEAVGYTVFVGLERAASGWMVQEIRILG